MHKPSAVVYVIAVLVLLMPLLARSPAQDKSVHLEDNSDWFSVIGADKCEGCQEVQNRWPAGSNYQIRGVSLRDEVGLTKKFGAAVKVVRGDGAVSRDQVCYVSVDGRYHFIIERGELDDFAYFFEQGPDWNGSGYCSVSPHVAPDLSMDSGLKLGITPQQLQLILGRASLSEANRLVYRFEANVQTPPERLRELRGKFPEMSDAEFKSSFGIAHVTSYVEARFSADKVTYLAVSESHESY